MLIAPGRIGLPQRRRVGGTPAPTPTAPLATSAFAGTPKSGPRTFSNAHSTTYFGFDYGYNQQGTGAIALVDDPTGLHGKVLQTSPGAAGAAYVAEQFRYAAHKDAIGDGAAPTQYAVWLRTIDAGHFRRLVYIPSGSGSLFSAHPAGDTTQATPCFTIGYAASGSGFKFTVNGTAVGREIPYGWSEFGGSWNATADTLSLFTKLAGEGSWTTERSGAVAAFTAPQSIRSGAWSTSGGPVAYKGWAWSDLSFADTEGDFLFVACYVGFTDQTRMSAGLYCPDGLLTGATKARLRWAAGDDPTGGTETTPVALSGKANDQIALTITSGLTHNTNYCHQFEYLDDDDNVLAVSEPFLWGTLANRGTAVSAQLALASCWENTTAGHPYRDDEYVAATANGDYRKIGMLAVGDMSYEGSDLGQANPYRTLRPDQSQGDFTQAKLEFFADMAVHRNARRGPMRMLLDDHETASNPTIKYLPRGALAGTLASAYPEANNTNYQGGITIGEVIGNGLQVYFDWFHVHNLNRVSDTKYYSRFHHGNIEVIGADGRYERIQFESSGNQVMSAEQMAWHVDQINDINATGTAELTIFYSQVGLSGFTSKSTEGWHNIAATQAQVFNDALATLTTKSLFLSGDVHLGYVAHTKWNATTANPTKPANFIAEVKGSGCAQNCATSVQTDYNADPGNVPWKYVLSSMGSGKRVIRSSPVMMTIGMNLSSIVVGAKVDGGAPSTHTLYTAAADTTAPTINSSATFSVAENVTLAHALTASESVTWTIVGGADAADYEISGSTLRWAGNTTRDYEAPVDADTNNSYIVTVRATDGAGNFTDQTITGTVTDVSEGGGGYTFTNSEAAALVAARTDSITDAHKGHIDTLVGSLKAAGAFNWDMLYVLIGANDASTRLNYANPAANPLTGAATFTSGQGLTGNGANLLSTGKNANATTHMLGTSGTMFVWVAEAGATVGSTLGIATGNTLRINPRGGTGSATSAYHETSSTGPTVASAVGLTAISRTGDATHLYRNGAEISNRSTLTNSAPGAVDLTVLGANGVFPTHRVICAGFGAYLDATAHAALYSALSTYFTARGVS